MRRISSSWLGVEIDPSTRTRSLRLRHQRYNREHDDGFWLPVVRFTLPDGPAGTEITVRHAEVLEHGELGTRPLRRADATDVIVLDGKGPRTWEPRFTFHGFRYAEVSGWPGELAPQSFTAVVVGTEIEPTGTFGLTRGMVTVQHLARPTQMDPYFEGSFAVHVRRADGRWGAPALLPRHPQAPRPLTLPGDPTMQPIPELTPLLKQLRLSGILDSLEARNREAIDQRLPDVEVQRRCLPEDVAARLHPLYGAGRYQQWRLFAGNRGPGDDHVALRHHGRHQFPQHGFVAHAVVVGKKRNLDRRETLEVDVWPNPFESREQLRVVGKRQLGVQSVDDMDLGQRLVGVDRGGIDVVDVSGPMDRSALDFVADSIVAHGALLVAFLSRLE